tara:strand:- start:8038 stop:8262 length:225 start_codon:yes stop_codon:yes gene_type:complete
MSNWLEDNQFYSGDIGDDVILVSVVKANLRGKVYLTKKQYNLLQESHTFLKCLEAVGVDNWVGYGDAQEMMEKT